MAGSRDFESSGPASTTRGFGVDSWVMTLSRAAGRILGAAVFAALLGFVPADTARRGAAARAADQEQKLGAGVFLVAAHRLLDPRFSQTVILLTQHGPQGAMGVIINRPTEHRLSDLLPEIEALQGRSDRLFFGGPVGVNAIVVLLQSAEEVELEHTERVFGDVYFSGSPEAFAYIVGREKEGEAIRGYAGYAGWAPGQLEGEIARGDWSILGADASTVFRKEPSTLWKELSPEPEPGRELRADRYPRRPWPPSSREMPPAW
jgi:putative transcriptional regulator